VPPFGIKKTGMIFLFWVAPRLLPVVFFLELFDAAAGFEQQLLASGVKRMALRADLDVYVLFRRTRDEFVPAAALDLRLKIFRLYRFPQFVHLRGVLAFLLFGNGLHYNKQKKYFNNLFSRTPHR